MSMGLLNSVVGLVKMSWAACIVHLPRPSLVSSAVCGPLGHNTYAGLQKWPRTTMSECQQELTSPPWLERPEPPSLESIARMLKEVVVPLLNGMKKAEE